MSQFFVYVDWTTEETPRPFYVGKGNMARVAMLRRNIIHSRIAAKHGLRREIVLETHDEAAALVREQELIAELRTCVFAGLDCWGANLTMGGEGVAGLVHNDESRRLMSAARKAAFMRDPSLRERTATSVRRLWTDPVYRSKNMVAPPADVESLRYDCETMPYDDVATKHNVSATTVKRWCRELGLSLARTNVKRERHSWTCDEESRLIEMHGQGMLVRDIAAALCLRDGPVKKRIQQLCTGRSRFRRRPQ